MRKGREGKRRGGREGKGGEERNGGKKERGRNEKERKLLHMVLLLQFFLERPSSNQITNDAPQQLAQNATGCMS